MPTAVWPERSPEPSHARETEIGRSSAYPEQLRRQVPLGKLQRQVKHEPVLDLGARGDDLHAQPSFAASERSLMTCMHMPGHEQQA